MLKVWEGVILGLNVMRKQKQTNKHTNIKRTWYYSSLRIFVDMLPSWRMELHKHNANRREVAPVEAFH